MASRDRLASYQGTHTGLEDLGENHLRTNEKTKSIDQHQFSKPQDMNEHGTLSPIPEPNAKYLYIYIYDYICVYINSITCTYVIAL